MATVVRSKFSAILPLIRTRLQSKTGFPAERVYLCIKEVTPEIVQADQYIVIRPRGATPNQPVEIGAGRIDTRVTRRITVVLRTRLEVDQDGTAATWLTDATLGHLDAEHAILDALQDGNDWCADASGNWLICQPIKLVSITQPDADPQFTGWGYSASEWDVTHELDLDQSYQ